MRSDADHPWFRPLWTRILVTLVCAAWAALEWWSGPSMWAWIASGMTLYAVWLFLLPRRGTVDDGKTKE
jgi:hypothetical protein